MARWSRRWLALASPILLVGCGILTPPVPSGMPEWVALRRPLPACGSERIGPAGGANRDARACLLAEYDSGGEGELVSELTTVEGDPVTQYLRVHANGTIEMFVDGTRDPLGSGAWERYVCRALVPVEVWNRPPDNVVPAEYVFVQDSCEALPIP